VIADDERPGARAVDDRVGQPRQRSNRIGRLFLLALLAGLAVWIGLRVRTAMHTQKELAQERTEQARSAGEAGPQKLKVVRPEPRRWLPTLAVEGTLQPVRESDLGFKVGGRLASIKVKMGDLVHQGKTLAVLDSAEAEAQKRAAEAMVKSAEAQLALTDDSNRRTSALVASGAQAEAMGIQTAKQRDLAATQAEGARAQLELAQAALASHVLAAPFSGYLTKVPTGPGAIVGPGAPLFHLQDVSTLKLTGTVSEADAPLAHVGAQVTVQLDGGRTVSGTVTAVLASVDPATRRLPVEAQVPNPRGPGQAAIIAGTFVRARIAGDAPIEVLALPQATLRPGSQGEVMVARGGKLEARAIAYVASADGMLLVRSGLRPDDQVVLAPSPEAKEGDPVVIEALPAAPVEEAAAKRAHPAPVHP
jgi:RND family efflux transporter MFP subunit